ncbi:hypothetical protein SFC43_22680 [Bacteroides sp. CR5/BHMF/2]|nr:hypothetical protein [Bacteroides sp. CR5/BHMF/2]
MNNTTVLGTTGTSNNSVTVNGDAYFMLANTTIVGNSGNPNGVFRAGKMLLLWSTLYLPKEPEIELFM